MNIIKCKNYILKIPRNIFQTWETKDISDGFKTLTQSWKNNNPNYAYFLLDDNERRMFIKKNFGDFDVIF